MKPVKRFEIVLFEGTNDERRVEMPNHTAKIMWEAMETAKVVQEGRFESRGDFEDVVKKVCGWYDDLTFDDIMEGLPSNKVIDFLLDSCDYLTQGTVGRFDDLKNAAARVLINQ